MDQFPHELDAHEGVVAVGRAGGRDRAVFIPAFAHMWPIEEATQFAALLDEIDDAECEGMRGGAGDFR
jgi:hypothetical protein